MTLPLLARADVTVRDNGQANVPSRIIFTVEGIPNACGSPLNKVLTAGDNQQAAACFGSTFGNMVFAVGRDDFLTPRGILEGVWAYGNASAGGGNQIETLPDSTVISGVGLYVTGGGNNLLNPPADSMMGVKVARSGNTVTLTIPTIVVGGVSVGAGGMQVRAANANESSIAEYKVIVYPNDAAANADINHDGFGSNFYGVVVLEAGYGIHPNPVSTFGGFSDADFILQTHPGIKKYTLRPIAGFSKVVNVPTGAAGAVVLTVADPRSVSRPVPSSSPIGLVLLALALMASGAWVMRSRQRTLAA